MSETWTSPSTTAPFVGQHSFSAGGPTANLTADTRVAVIGDVGGYVNHLQHALAALGVRDGLWPEGLHIIQLGDLFGGRADIEVAQLVRPHVIAGRWTQLIGNWELEAVGGIVIHRNGHSPHPDAIAEFRGWHRLGLVYRAATVTASSGTTGIVTHAGISHRFWIKDLNRECDPHEVAARLNQMPLDQVARPGSMLGRPNEPAPGTIWSSETETWGQWSLCPWPQIHGHTTAWRPGLGWSHFMPSELRDRCSIDRGHVTFTPSPASPSIISIDPGLWARSTLGRLRPLVFAGASASQQTV
jgi:hypothetical protein